MISNRILKWVDKIDHTTIMDTIRIIMIHVLSETNSIKYPSFEGTVYAPLPVPLVLNSP